jgi:alpha/beta superfamily hydrolase
MTCVSDDLTQTRLTLADFMKDFEKEFFIAGPAGQIQAYDHSANAQGALFDQKKIAIICHPHPQHGGTMDNKVVTTLMRVYRDLGINVVRFNFRGVGKSEGEFAHGQGEYQDLIAVVQQVTMNYPGHQLLLAGFSFGSSIAARASYAVSSAVHLCLVAPPVERYEYDKDSAFTVPLCVIQGDNDERVIAQGVYDWCGGLKSPAHLIRYPEATHFFHGYLSQIKTDLTQHLLSQFA